MLIALRIVHSIRVSDGSVPVEARNFSTESA